MTHLILTPAGALSLACELSLLRPEVARGILVRILGTLDCPDVVAAAALALLAVL